MSGQVIVARRPGLIEADVGGDLIALHVDNGACYGFNPTATRIWRLIEQPQDLDALCRTLTIEYAVDREACREQVVAILRQLEGEGLVAFSEGPPTA